MITTILTDRVNFANDIKYVREQWLGDLLSYIGVDTEELAELPRDIGIEYLVSNDIEVIEYTGIDAMEVRFEGDVIGEWAGPTFTLKEDSQGALYFEAEVEHWSIIEEEIEEDLDE
jgi:hypothetical protein